MNDDSNSDDASPWGSPISTYSREMALADGVLVDLTVGDFRGDWSTGPFASVHVACTRAVFELGISDDCPVRHQATAALRCFEIIDGLCEAVREMRAAGESRIDFGVLLGSHRGCVRCGLGPVAHATGGHAYDDAAASRVPGLHYETPGGDLHCVYLLLRAELHMGDHGEPCLTIMLRDED